MPDDVQGDDWPDSGDSGAAAAVDAVQAEIDAHEAATGTAVHGLGTASTHPVGDFDSVGAASAAQAAAVATAAADATTKANAAQAAAIAASAQRASNLSDLANAGTARTNLGLGTAATHAHGDYEAAGAAATAQAAAATDATTKANAAQAAAIAASAQRASNLSDLANAGTSRTNLGLGTAATHAHGDYETAGAAATAQAAAIAAAAADATTKADAAKARAAHTGTQAASTIVDFTEAAQDVIGALLVDSADLDYTYDDAGNAETVIIKPTARQEVVQFMLTDMTTAVAATGDAKGGFYVAPKWNGWKLVSANMALMGAVSTSGIPTVQIRRSRPPTPTDQDMLSTKITVDANEFDSSTAATPAVVDTASSHDILNTGDRVFGDIDVTGTGAKGWLVSLTIQAP